jgi:hypothetical protein
VNSDGNAEFEKWRKSCNSKCGGRRQGLGADESPIDIRREMREPARRLAKFVRFKQGANGAYVAIDGPGKDDAKDREGS